MKRGLPTLQPCGPVSSVKDCLDNLNERALMHAGSRPANKSFNDRADVYS
jgi:hypothetical protein